MLKKQGEKESKMNIYVYEFEGSLYVNLTNKCCNNCTFCIRNSEEGVDGIDLWLSKEPTYDEVLNELSKFDLSKFSSIVFCGYGEPLYRLDLILQLTPVFKQKGLKVRINTNGLGNLLNKNIEVAKELKKVGIDVVSISLNTSSSEKYDAICKPMFKNSFDEMLKFAKECVDAKIETKMTVVDCIGEEEIEKCRAIAENCGAIYRVRTLVK